MRNSNAARAPRDDGQQHARPEREQGPRLQLAPPMPVAGPRVPFVVMIVVLVMAGVVGILALNQKINENAFRLDKLRAEQARLDRQEQDLNQQIAEKEAPGNLAAQARKLGLVPAGAPAFIRLPDGRVVGVPQPASGQPAITSQGG
jgi:outer membrane murein-binding lipoprotein Lpp